MAVTTSQITITTMEGWYSGDTAPSNPLIGDLWLDTTSNEIKKWDGTNWVKQADTQGPQGPKGDSMISREAYWIKSSTKPEPPDPETGDMKGWEEGSEPPESALNGILPSDKFWRIYKETYSDGENEYSKYSDVELIGSYEVLKGLVQFRNGVTTTENIGGQDVTVIDGGKILTGSIEADKMSIKDLSALKAKIGGFNIGENSIYSGTKSSINNREKGIYFDSNGHLYFGDDKSYMRFFQSADDGKYKLKISTDSLVIGSGLDVEKAFEDIKGDIQNVQGTADNVKDQIVSMGEQLIINGNGLMGDNTNFSALIFDASKANGSPGSFTREGTSYMESFSDSYIPINPNLRYSFEIDAISKNGLIRMYSFLNFYDVDKKSIESESHMYIENTLTYLTQDLKNGDTVVHFNDLSGWNDTFTQNYRRGFIFWNYTNSFGYTYPELTYSRNIWRNLYENSNVDKTNNTITLNAPWSHGTFEAGTKLSQCNAGSTYKYQGMSYTKVPTEWTHYSGFYDDTDYSGKNVLTKFPPGTAYAKVGFLWNYNNLDDQCWVTNISLKTDYDNAIKNAQTAADKAQGAADKAQNSANTAQNTATEAAKTADNYISTDSTGIMVSENKGATKETPSNATKNNVLITEKDVQIRNGQKVVASYGDTTIIGTEEGNHIIISDDFIQAKNGDAESLKISLTPDRPVTGRGVDFDGSTVAQRVKNNETITIVCQLGEDAISVDTAFLVHESIGGTDLIIDNSKSWIQYILNTNSVTVTIDGSDTEAKAVQWEKFFQLVIRYIPVRQYTSNIECDNLTAVGSLKVGNRINANAAELEGIYIGSDVYIGKYIGSDRSGFEYLDESGKRANLIQITEGTGFLELDTGKVEFHPRWWRCGNIVQMEVGVKCAGEVASGANIAAGFVTGVPKPITKSGVRAVSYYGNNANISYLSSSDGTFYARNAGADALKKDNSCIGVFTYITDGTMV